MQNVKTPISLPPNQLKEVGQKLNKITSLSTYFRGGSCLSMDSPSSLFGIAIMCLFPAHILCN